MGCFVPRPRDDFKFPNGEKAARHLAIHGFSVSGGFVWSYKYSCPLGGVFDDGGGYYSQKPGTYFIEERNRLKAAVGSYVPVQTLL